MERLLLGSSSSGLEPSKVASFDVVVSVSHPAFPGSDVLLSRLARSQGDDFLGDVDRASVEEILRRLADRLGMQSFDLFLMAGLDVPENALPSDGIGSGALPRLVGRALQLPESDRGRLREFAQSLPATPMSPTLRWGVLPSGEQYPPGFGSLLVRMLALRNMGWSAAAHVMREMSGVYLSASSIGAIARGVRELDAELVIGLAAVLGIPVGLLETLMGVDLKIGDHMHSPENRDVADLIWDVRQLTSEEVRQVSDLAERLGS